MKSTLTLARGMLIYWVVATHLFGGQPGITQPQPIILRQIATEYRQHSRAEKRKAEQLARSAGMSLRRILPDGRVAEIQRIIGGHPIYYITTNLEAARTVSTDLIWPLGGLGITLTGKGMVIGVWDEGGVLRTHQEYAGRVTHADGVTGTSDHASHIAGTLVARGVVSSAKGMAYEGSAESYDWNDDIAETAAAAASGLTLSNHSYSTITGWQLDIPNSGWNWWGDMDISPQEDYRFGYYDSAAYYWDQIALNAPTYLIVASAGNDRADEGPLDGETHWVWHDTKWIRSSDSRTPDGDFDCLPGGVQVAKNVLVAGAVEDIPYGYSDASNVLMTEFSSWGPTDDGRIKPDIVANGRQLYSTLASGEAAYGYFSGTSMAASNVTGSLALLQEHWANTHTDQLLHASTLRALVIHTADEAGSLPGPDYRYGWGLLNTASAADLISRDAEEPRFIQEVTLYTGMTYSITVVSDGEESLKATIAWIDPPGPVHPPQLDVPIPVLVNDLDLKVKHAPSGQDYYPWYLDFSAPAGAADVGDNSVDNVEQSLINSPPAGEYTISVTSKGTLQAGAQEFSIVVTGVTFDPLPQILIWEGDSSKVDYSGVFIRDTLQRLGNVSLTYTNAFPETLSGYNAIFLSFGPSGALANRTFLDKAMAFAIQAYLEEGGGLYLEGGDALGVDQMGNDTLWSLLGIDTVHSGHLNPIDDLEGQPGTVASGMLFTASTQLNYQYPDIFYPDQGISAFNEKGYGSVAVQHVGKHGQRTFVFSYALGGLADDALPSTRLNLLAELLSFFMTEPPPSPNSPPLAEDDPVSTQEDSALSIRVLDNDRDPESDRLFLIAVTQGIHGAVQVDAGDTTVSYQPDAHFFGADSFRYAVSDGNGGLDTAKVIVSIISVNDPPLAEDDEAATWEEVAVVIPVLANDSDIEGDALYIAGATAGVHGSVDIMDGDTTISYLPDEEFNSTDTFEYTVSDRNGGVDTARVIVTVAPANDPVVALDDTVSTHEDTPAVIPVLANDFDPDGDSLTVIEVGGPLHGTAFINPNRAISYYPALNYFGPDTFSYIVTDELQSMDTASVYARVMPVNDPPIANPDTFHVPEDSSIYVTPLSNDSDPDGDAYYLAGQAWKAGHGTVSMDLDGLSGETGSMLSYIPDPDYFGTDSFGYSISDGLLTDTAFIIITILPVNDPPLPFALREPGADTTVMVATTGEGDDSLHFVWEPAADIDDDMVWYLFEVWGALDALLPNEAIRVNRFSIPHETLAARAVEQGLSDSISGFWTVLATDGIDTTKTINGPSRLWVIIRSLEIREQDGVPLEFALQQNYPNPFNPYTVLRFAVPVPAEIRLVVIDLRGREIARLVDGPVVAGYHQVIWNGRTTYGKEAPSGLYIIRMTAPDFIRHNKIILLR